MIRSNDATGVFDHITMAGRDACWQWHGAWGGRDRDRRPYYGVNGKRYLAYRLVFTLVNGINLTSEELILHSCGNGSFPIGCCNPYHMRVGGEKENAHDMMEQQRHGLPKTVVRAIRRLVDDGRTHAQIAELYGIARETVTAIATGRSHKETDDDVR